MNAEKPKRGRPKKFAHIQCTYGEIAAKLGVSVDTLQRNRDFAAIYKKGAEGGRKSLRRMQFESANKGNIGMQIWLGKQYLDQSDQSRLEVQSTTSYLGDLSREQVGRAFSAMTLQELEELIVEVGEQLEECRNRKLSRRIDRAALPVPSSGEDNAIPATFTVEPSYE